MQVQAIMPSLIKGSFEFLRLFVKVLENYPLKQGF